MYVQIGVDLKPAAGSPLRGPVSRRCVDDYVDMHLPLVAVDGTRN